MEILKLYLSPIDRTRFKIIGESKSGQGETESILPFDGEDDRLRTILKILEARSFRAKDFPKEDEKVWMKNNGLFDKDRKIFPPDVHVIIGKSIYASLFPKGSKTEGLLGKMLAQAEIKKTQLQLQLKFEADVVGRPRLSDYPWELAHDKYKFLAHRQIVFSRYIAYNAAPPNLPLVERINVLLISSKASDPKNKLKKISTTEQKAVKQGLSKAEQEGYISLIQLERATFDALRTHLTNRRGSDAPYIIHFDGHGLFGKRCNNILSDGRQCKAIHPGVADEECKNCGRQLSKPQGYLVFESNHGQADYVSAKELGALLQKVSFDGSVSRQSNFGVVVLSACHSGLSLAGGSIFDGIAQNLIHHQVPAVVAMRFSVSVDGAAKFAEQFYRSLGQHDLLTMAVNNGREAMGVESNQWYRPVLYTRWQDNEGGQLFATIPTDPGWLKNRIQKAKTLFTNHLGGNEELSNQQANQRYLKLIVRKRSKKDKVKSSYKPREDFLDKFVQRGVCLLVIGEGGAGKTTSLLKLAIDVAHDSNTDPANLIPIYIKLNYFDTQEKGFDRLLEMIGYSSGLSKKKVRFFWRMSSRPFLFLLDGFNEIDSEFQQACALALDEFVQMEQHCYFNYFKAYFRYYTIAK